MREPALGYTLDWISKCSTHQQVCGYLASFFTYQLAQSTPQDFDPEIRNWCNQAVKTIEKLEKRIKTLAEYENRDEIERLNQQIDDFFSYLCQGSIIYCYKWLILSILKF